MFSLGLVLFASSLALANGQFVCGSLETYADENMAVAIQFSGDSNTVYITMSGPDDAAFAAGYGTSDMPNAYAIVVDGDGEVTEHKLSSNLGTTLTPMVTVEEENVANGVRTVKLSRDSAGTSSDYHSFDSEASSIDLIWAISGTNPGTAFTAHDSNGRGDDISISYTSGNEADSDACTLASLSDVEPSTTEESMQTTEEPMQDMPSTSMGDYNMTDDMDDSYTCGMATTSSDNDMKVAIRIDANSEMVYITLSGPDDTPFGTGIGATGMNGAYAIVVGGDGTVSEHSLTSNLGTTLTASVTKMNEVESGGVRTVLLKRALTVDDADYYDFNSGSLTLDLIWAINQESGTSFSGHSSTGRGAGVTITFAGGFSASDEECSLGTDYGTTGTPTDDDDDDSSDDSSATSLIVRFTFVGVLVSWFALN